MKNILLTGGAGYIGSHVALSLIEHGYKVTILDNLKTGHKKLIPKEAEFIKCDISDVKKLNLLFKKKNFITLIHLAALIVVEESIKYPKTYIKNNSEKSAKLFKTCIKHGLRNIIFSSTASVYGNRSKLPLKENTRLSPLNPYALSKVLTEQYLDKLSKENKINYVSLRYFNVAGADPQLRCGLISDKSSHLIKVISEAVTKKRDYVKIFGNNYPTPDGTAIRDYVHVSDVAEAHVLSLEYLLAKKKSVVLNCGYAKGYSVKKILDKANLITENSIKIKIGKRRKGDALSLIANNHKIKKILKWKPKFNNLEYILDTSIKWEKKQTMSKIYKRKFKRKDKKIILLFGYNKHVEIGNKQIKKTKSSYPHMRWHPLREEWVSYSAGRQNRTTHPSKKYCPLCPSQKIKYTTEIPFKKFEVAVFPNRWSSFNSHAKNYYLDNIKTKVAKGSCEIVVYSDDHNSTLAEMHQNRIELLINVWIDRYKELLSIKDIKYVMPFENRGEECGVTLHHPHGQIYAYPFIPPVIEKEIKAFNRENYILKIIQESRNRFIVYENEEMVAFVPPFARYSYEIWIVPKRRVPGPWKFDNNEIKSYADCIKKVIRGYDAFLKKKCPFVMGLHAAPNFEDKNFHFHTEFHPPLRLGNKPKILAGSESMAGVFIMDLLPEESAKVLRKYIS